MLDAPTSFQIARSGANKFKDENLFVYKHTNLAGFCMFTLLTTSTLTYCFFCLRLPFAMWDQLQ